MKLSEEEKKKKQELDKLRSSCLYNDEVLRVIYTGKAINFPKNEIIYAKPKSARFSGLPYPQPKWIACEYYIEDLDGDYYKVAKDRYGDLEPGFEWVK